MSITPLEKSYITPISDVDAVQQATNQTKFLIKTQHKFPVKVVENLNNSPIIQEQILPSPNKVEPSNINSIGKNHSDTEEKSPNSPSI